MGSDSNARTRSALAAMWGNPPQVSAPSWRALPGPTPFVARSRFPPGPLPPVLPQSPAAAVTDDTERLSATHVLSVLEPGSPTLGSFDGMKSRCPPGPATSGGLEGILPRCLWLLVAAGVPWFLGLGLHHPDLCLCGHMASPPLYVRPPSASLRGRDTRLHAASTHVIQGHRPISRS